MSEIIGLVDSLKRFLKSRGLTYAQLAAELDLSEIAVKKIFASSNMTLQRLQEICGVIGISIHELSLNANKSVAEQISVLSSDQDLALASDPNLLSVFYLVMNRWEAREILLCFKISKPQLTQNLIELDRLGLIELHPKNVIKLRTAPNIRWPRGGEIQSRYEKEAISEFLLAPFEGDSSFFEFLFYQFSQHSIKTIHKKMTNLRKEILELAEVDGSLPVDQKHDCGILVAMRPWLFQPLGSVERK